jgi:cell division protein FtsL
MSQQGLKSRRRRISLSVAVPLGLVFAAVIPLLITVVFSEYQTRPALTAQANAAMTSDAKNRVQLIDTYFRERLLDVATLAQVTSAQQFLAAPPPPATPLPAYQDLALHASYALVAGIFRDKHYLSWQLRDTHGNVRLYYPLNNKPQKQGQFLVPPEELQAVSSGKTFVSPVYYSPAINKAYVYLYAPMYAPTAPGAAQATAKPRYIGFIRATLNLDYVWNIVDGDKGDNGSGSYAFILDQNGVRIADTDHTQLFTAAHQLNPDVQMLISQEARYGSTGNVRVLSDAAMAAQLNAKDTLTTFQAQPAGQKESFQVVQQASSVLPWHYFVLSPVNTVTALANQQLLFTIVVAVLMSALVAIVGLIFGQNITRPILSSVQYLRSGSQSLSQLATRQQDAASEQMWVVDSSQVGLQSVQYYTQAIKVAARQLSSMGTDLEQRRTQLIDARTAMQALERFIVAARYIENAAEYQEASNQKLATALKVATQVTEQLVTGATSATEAASQLEQVVAQLRAVVGR